MFNTLQLEQFVPARALEFIVGELHTAAGAVAEVYGVAQAGRVEPRVRSARKLEAPVAVRDLVIAMLAEVQQALSEHFGVVLTSFEEPQFLRYEKGDFFVPHQDGNTGLIHDDSMHRRVSAVIFLNSPDGRSDETRYGGGALTLHGKYPHFDVRHVVPAIAGSLVAFPSDTTHEVTPVTFGQRFTIVSWYR